MCRPFPRTPYARCVSVFSRLQAAMDEGRTDQLTFFAFDLLFLNGHSTRNFR